MACQHVLTNSVTYPVGTRCGKCGESAESILANCQSELLVMRGQLAVEQDRAKVLEEEKLAAADLRRALESTRGELQERKAQQTELAKQLSQQLAQVESLSKENIRLTGELRQAVERETALQRKLEEFETAEAQNPASITQHSRRVEVPERRR